MESVDNPEFRHLFEKHFQTTLPTSKTLRMDVGRAHSAVNHSLKEICAEWDIVAVTIDGWTQRRGENFDAVVASTVRDGAMQSRLVSFLPAQGRHTGKGLCLSLSVFLSV
jgi:hypothetical protein